MKIEYRPIGIVHSPFRHPEGTPIQPGRAKGAEGTVEVFREYEDALGDLAGFSHIILLCHLHKSRGYRLKVVPFLDTEPRGLFATRAPNRPNSIGLSIVRLLAVNGNILSVTGVDLLDGTPLLDIKPYVREFDEQTGAHSGWLESAGIARDTADGRFN